MKIIFSENEIEKTAKELLEVFDGKRIFLFYGEMGSGKTTFIKEIVKQLGSTDIVQSPTFSIINEYQCAEGKIFHLDLYRLKNLEEAFNAGVMECVNGDDFCFIEWPALIEKNIEEQFVIVQFSIGENNERILELKI